MNTIQEIRRDFPQFDECGAGPPIVYLANDKLALMPRAVIDRIKHVFEREYSNVHRGLHYLSNATTDAFEGARESVRAFVGAVHLDEIIITRSGIQAIDLVRYWLTYDDFTTIADKAVAVISPTSEDLPILNAAVTDAKAAGAKVIVTPQFWHAKYGQAALISFANACHDQGLLLLLDGRINPLVSVVDVTACNIDFYVLDSQTCHGPGGVGILYGKKHLLDRAPPMFGGGEMVAEVSENHVAYADPPYRFEAGTPAIAEVIGFGHALTYLSGLGRSSLAEQYTHLAQAVENLFRGTDLLNGFDSSGRAFFRSMCRSRPQVAQMLINKNVWLSMPSTDPAKSINDQLCAVSSIYNQIEDYQILKELLQFNQAERHLHAIRGCYRTP